MHLRVDLPRKDRENGAPNAFAPRIVGRESRLGSVFGTTAGEHQTREPPRAYFCAMLDWGRRDHEAELTQSHHDVLVSM